MNSYKKLVGNSFIFAIGDLGSKLISFILVPLYTYYLTTFEYGTVDLIVTTVNMLLPIVSASIFDAVLRFVMDKDKPKDNILSNSLMIATLGLMIALLFYPVLNYYGVMQNSLLYMYMILFFQILEKILNQYTRAIGKIKLFAINGIILTITTGLLNILFLVVLSMGIQGYFLSIIFANLLSVIFLFFSTKAYKEIKFSNIDKKTTKSMLQYSIPLIPNSLMWWLVNASSRYFILYFVGVGANGLFAVASKIPSLISIVNQVFTQAWQLSAIEEYENENKSVFYSNVFSYLATLMFIGVSLITMSAKLIFNYLFSIGYYEAWKIVPFLLLSAVFSSFSGFLGTNYIAAKQTKGVFKTSVYGGIISIILNFIFIPALGIMGAGISAMISFFVIFIIRYFDTKQFIDMKINWKLFIANIVIIFIQILILMLELQQFPELIIEFCLFFVLLLINRKLLKPILFLIKSIKVKKNK